MPRVWHARLQFTPAVSVSVSGMAKVSVRVSIRVRVKLRVRTEVVDIKAPGVAGATPVHSHG